jgi:hypothetical protein
MKSFQQFQEDLSRNTVPLGKKEQGNLNRARRGQIGPRSTGVPHLSIKLVPTNIPMK